MDKLVLAYHAVSENWDSSLAVQPGALAEQVESLLADGYRAAGFTETVTASGGEDLFAVTFDDAYLSVFELAFGVLSELGVVATVFVPTRFPAEEQPMSWPGVEQWLGTEHEPEMRCMSWDHAAELADAGWEIGSHTRTHARLTKLDDRALGHELRVSKETCERALGRPCRSIAYPFGDFNARVSTAAAAVGYEVGAGMPGRYRGSDPMQWPRVGVYPADDLSRFRAKIDPRMRRLRATRAWELVLSLRRRPRS